MRHFDLRASHLLFTVLLVVVATASPARAQVILFQDDFDAGLGPGWTFGSPVCDSGTWRCEDGQLCNHITGYEVCTVAIAGDATWSNYAVSVDVTLNAGNNRIVAINWVDRTHHVHVNLNSFFNAALIVTGEDQIIMSAPFEFVAGATYNVRLGIFGTVLGVEIDGVGIGTIDVSPWIAAGIVPAQGRIALWGWAGGAVQINDICFDNVVVEQLQAVGIEQSSWGTTKAAFR